MISIFIISLGFCLARSFSIHSGAILNPAAGFGLILIECLKLRNYDKIKHFWIYVIGPILGEILANIFYEYIFKPNHEIKKFFRRYSSEIKHKSNNTSVNQSQVNLTTEGF